MSPWMWLLFVTVAALLLALLAHLAISLVGEARKPGLPAKEIAALDRLAKAVLDGRVWLDPVRPHVGAEVWVYRLNVDPEFPVDSKREEV